MIEHVDDVLVSLYALSRPNRGPSLVLVSYIFIRLAINNALSAGEIVPVARRTDVVVIICH